MYHFKTQRKRTQICLAILEIHRDEVRETEMMFSFRTVYVEFELENEMGQKFLFDSYIFKTRIWTQPSTSSPLCSAWNMAI